MTMHFLPGGSGRSVELNIETDDIDKVFSEYKSRSNGFNVSETKKTLSQLIQDTKNMPLPDNDDPIIRYVNIKPLHPNAPDLSELRKQPKVPDVSEPEISDTSDISDNKGLGS